MSQINTNGINVNYPVPGVNNNSQGFRDNFAAIKTNLDAASTEITDLQNKAVLKAALNGQTLNNDMANALMSNTLTRGFRASTYNLGNAISGTVVVNVSQGDVQYGTIAGNTTIQFAGWAPSGTQSNVQLELTISNANAIISFPTQVKMSGTYGVETLENFANVGNIPTVSVPYGVSQLEYRLSTIDCGNSITIEPFNRPRQVTQIQQRIPTPQGQPGDTTGTVCVEPSTSLAYEVCTDSNATTDLITCSSTSGFYLDMPVQFTGFVGATSFLGANVTAGTTYYIRTISTSGNSFTISSLPGTVSGPGTLVNVATGSGSVTITPVNYLYVATGAYDTNNAVLTRLVTSSNAYTTSVTANVARTSGNLTVSDTANLVVGYPITFSASTVAFTLNTSDTTGNVNLTGNVSELVVNTTIQVSGDLTWTGNLVSGNTYFVRSIDTGTSNIKLGSTFGGSVIPLSLGTANLSNLAYGVAGNRSGTLMGGLNSANTYYLLSKDSGTGNITISNDINGPILTFYDENGNVSVTATTNYVVNITASGNGTIQNNDPVIFTGNVGGGLQANTVYYACNVAPSAFSVSATRFEGVAGQKVPLANYNSSGAIATFTQGTAIWKRSQLSSW